MAEKEVVGSVAHDNSNGGVAVICRHEDKVVVWSMKMIVSFKILMMMMITIITITVTITIIPVVFVLVHIFVVWWSVLVSLLLL